MISELTPITVANTGSMTGVWVVKCKSCNGEPSAPFKVSPGKFELRPTATRTLQVTYTGPPDVPQEGLVFVSYCY